VTGTVPLSDGEPRLGSRRRRPESSGAGSPTCRDTTPDGGVARPGTLPLSCRSHPGCRFAFCPCLASFLQTLRHPVTLCPTTRHAV
jgi:hypothetical protein